MGASMANSKSADGWRKRQWREGFKRVTIWVPPDTVPELDSYCEEHDVPAAVAVEHIVRKHFGRM